MRHPLPYTFLGFHFNSLIDKGEILNLDETHHQIKAQKLFEWLKSKFGDALDISLFSAADLAGIEIFFESLSLSVNERRKFGVTNNGLCLLVAYCFEAAQRNPEEIR